MGATSAKLINTRLDGKTAVVTGCNVGIGRVTAKELYRMGAKVIMACRDVKKAESAMESIKNELKEESNVGKLVVVQLNLNSLASVKQCAEEINTSEQNINLLINNAGVMMCPKGKTEDGCETHFGVNHLGHFVFTNLLLPKIIESAPSRIINLSSSAHERGTINYDDLNYENRSYSGWGAYSQSKLANVLFSIELAKRLKDKDVTVYSVHPGIVKTELGRHLDETYFPGARAVASVIFSFAYKTPEQGALTTLYCALKEDTDNNGGYFSDCRLNKAYDDEKHSKDAAKLWEKSVEMTQKFLN